MAARSATTKNRKNEQKAHSCAKPISRQLSVSCYDNAPSEVVKHDDDNHFERKCQTGRALLWRYQLRWCWLELGHAAIMLQEFLPESQPKETLGTGVSVCFTCEDALALYREFKSRGIQTQKRPSVGNRLWVVPLTDPDGYRIEFESPTDVPEDRSTVIASHRTSCRSGRRKPPRRAAEELQRSPDSSQRSCFERLRPDWPALCPAEARFPVPVWGRRSRRSGRVPTLDSPD